MIEGPSTLLLHDILLDPQLPFLANDIVDHIILYYRAAEVLGLQHA